MPKKSHETMEARKGLILGAAKTLFARQGYSATSIQDIAREAGVSSGNIYTHFSSKGALLEELSGTQSERAQELQPVDWATLLQHLRSAEGLSDAKLDLNLWAEATRDDAVNDSVRSAIDAFQRNLRESLPEEQRGASTVALFEALALGAEVQRCLGRRLPSTQALRKLMDEKGG